MSNKTYILQKDLPGSNVGAIALWDNGVEAYRVFGDATTRHIYYFPKAIVENNPTWFKPEEPERIEVTDFIKGAFYRDPRINESSYQLVTSIPIPGEKYPAIKKAIEDILNNDKLIPHDWSEAIKHFKKCSEIKAMFSELKYTEEDLKNAFYAGRSILSLDKYPTFQDYLNHINNKP